MPMTQEDIRTHYRTHWKTVSDNAMDVAGLRYSSEIEDAVAYPVYRQLIRDLRITVDGGHILDVGCGAGRWVRYFLEGFRPASITGIDVAQASIDLLNKWSPDGKKVDAENKLGLQSSNIDAASIATALDFQCIDMTQPNVDLGRKFDLINSANVLFHIPEPDLFDNCLRNLANHLAPDGRIVTTEYLPRTTMRTEWMLVRSRYDFEAAAAHAGLRIAAVRAHSFFSNDPMGLDGLDTGPRARFNKVRQGIQSVMNTTLDPNTHAFFVNLFADIERAMLDFCRERVADLDLPSQKLVVLSRSSSGMRH